MDNKFTQEFINKAFTSVKKYLKERDGYSKPVWCSEFCDWLIVYDCAEDEPIARLTKVVYNDCCDDDTPPTRKEFEDVMVSLIMEGVLEFECSIVCDCVYVKRLLEDKALIKHHINCLD